jgi:tRNA threonylcarbamoyladenosine biosynthesis protein TsaB
MNLLALDTSTLHAAVALKCAGGAILISPGDPAMRHGRVLIPSIQALLAEARLHVRDLDAVAVGLGPGSYTGLRIGITAAKTLVYVVKKPLIGLDSLEIIARGAPVDQIRISVVADAQRGDVFTADFERAESGAPLRRVSVTRVESLEAWLAGIKTGTFVMGPALERADFPLPAGSVRCGTAANAPQGEALIQLAEESMKTCRLEDPALLEPVYLRRSAAEDQWKAKARP